MLLERNPHLLFEGCVIGCCAIGAKVAYIYIRGEFYHVQQAARGRARRRPAPPATSARTSSAAGVDCDIYVHRGAGAYEAGEETALIESLEGKRAQPRIKPPFPGRGRPLRLPDGGQQRRDALQRARRSSSNGAEWFAGDRPREERGAEAVLRQRPRQEARASTRRR